MNYLQWELTYRSKDPNKMINYPENRFEYGVKYNRSRSFTVES